MTVKSKNMFELSEYKEVQLKHPHPNPHIDEQTENYDEDDRSTDHINLTFGQRVCACLKNSCIRCIRGGINLHKSQYVPEDEYSSGCRDGWKPVYEVVFESSTMSGQMFDLVLIILISVSVTTAVLDSVGSIRLEYGPILLVLECLFSLTFSVEYFLRAASIRKPSDYICSPMGILDATSIIPTYIGVFVESARPLVHLAVLRVLRVLRVFRVLKLVRFVDEAASLTQSMQENKRRIIVFLFGVFTIILVIGCAMYLIEGEIHGFSSIPVSLYWTVVTLTTVGYGDIAPQTIIGRFLATIVMLCGYGVIACPLVLQNQGAQSEHDSSLNVACPRCRRRHHQKDANFCRLCGTALSLPRRGPKTRKGSYGQMPDDTISSVTLRTVENESDQGLEPSISVS